MRIYSLTWLRIKKIFSYKEFRENFCKSVINLLKDHFEICKSFRNGHKATGILSIQGIIAKLFILKNLCKFCLRLFSGEKNFGIIPAYFDCPIIKFKTISKETAGENFQKNLIDEHFRSEKFSLWPVQNHKNNSILNRRNI